MYEYKFEDPNNYNSLVLRKHKKYTLIQEDIYLDEVINLSNQVQITEEPKGIPFPQADSFVRVINICELLNEKTCLTRDEITYEYDFDFRQTNYYTDAARYLGLITKENDEDVGVKYFLTEQARAAFSLEIKSRNMFFIHCILQKKVFHESFNKFIINSEIPSNQIIVQIMKRNKLHNVISDSTYQRRASTVLGWIKWIIDLVK